MQVVGFKTALRRDGAVDETPENISGDANHALVLADSHAELDGLDLGVPAGVLRKGKKHGGPPVEAASDVLILFSDQSIAIVMMASPSLDRQDEGEPRCAVVSSRRRR